MEAESLPSQKAQRLWKVVAHDASRALLGKVDNLSLARVRQKYCVSSNLVLELGEDPKVKKK
jgi:hypothetical protein